MAVRRRRPTPLGLDILTGLGQPAPARLRRRPVHGRVEGHAGLPGVGPAEAAGGAGRRRRAGAAGALAGGAASAGQKAAPAHTLAPPGRWSRAGLCPVAAGRPDARCIASLFQAALAAGSHRACQASGDRIGRPSSRDSRCAACPAWLSRPGLLKAAWRLRPPALPHARRGPGTAGHTLSRRH